MTTATDNNNKNESYKANDLLYGADAIAEFLFGHSRLRRRVYHLVARSKLPTFRIGTNICARRTALSEWIMQQERRQML